MKPETRIELTARASPECVELARWVCLATRVDAALIRRARLGLMRGASAAVESDLWFSPLVQTAGTRYILFYPDVVNLLRRSLAENRRHLACAWRLTRRTHRGLSELVRLEEKINWLALKDDPRLERKLDALLRPLIKAILMGQREGLGRWALNVIPHMPARARESRSARLLRVVAESQLYGGWANLLTTTGEGPTDEEAALLLHGLERTSAGLRLRGDRLEVSEPPEDDSRLIKVPATNPRVLELTWPRGESFGQLRLTWKKGERAHAEGLSLPVTVNTLAGDSHRLVYGGEVADSLHKLAAPFFVFTLDHEGRPVGMGVLVGNNFVLTTFRSVRDAVQPKTGAGVKRTGVRFPYVNNTGGFALTVGRDLLPESTVQAADRPLLLRLDEPDGAARPAKLKSAFDFVGKVLAAPGLPPYDAAQRWATFEVGAANEAGEFALIPATQIRPEDLTRWSGAPLIDTGTGEVAGVALVRDEVNGPRLTLFPLNLITRDFPQIFDAGSEVLFIYSHSDEGYVERLHVHMAPLHLEYRVDLALWSDERIKSGSLWRDEIARAVESAAAVVLFVSANYLASDFMAEDALTPLLERAQERGALVLPVIVSPSMFERTPLARYQAVNSPAKPLSSMTEAGREEVYVRLADLLSRQLGDKPEAREEPRTEASHDFFICYHKADITWAEWVAWELEEAGYSTVVQASDFRPGRGFAQSAMAEAAYIIFILSPDSLGAEYTTPEWAAAFAAAPGDAGRRSLPVRVREVTPTGLLSTLKYIDLVGLDENDAREALLRGVRRVQPQPVRPSKTGGEQATFPGEPPTVPRPVPPEPDAPREFKTDIYVSYAHIDNERLAEGSKGWVDTFHERLKVRLGQLMGRTVSILRDQKLRGSDSFSDATRNAISESRLFVSIVTPAYVKSEWCRAELREFVRDAQQAGGSVRGRTPVFKVVKSYVPREAMPEELLDTVGYEFFEYDADTGRAREFSPDVVPARDIRYWERLDDLAYDINLALSAFDEAAPAPRPEGGVEAVYLAQTTRDVMQERDFVRRDFVQRGYVVLPDEELPLYEPDFDAAVRESLARCRMSVHLFGARYGVIPEGGDGRSVAHRQLELAAERAASDPTFIRLVWLPPGLQLEDERQRALFESLQSGVGVGAGTEVMQAGLETFREYLVEKLAAKPGAPPAADSPDRRKSIYLICDRQDLDEVSPLVDFLYERGFDVILPAMEGDETAILEDHKMNLMECDAAVIYGGRANDVWLRYKLRDLSKIAGYGRAKPLFAKVVYLAPPVTEWKEMFRAHDLTVIKNFEAFSPDAMTPLLELLESPRPR